VSPPLPKHTPRNAMGFAVAECRLPPCTHGDDQGSCISARRHHSSPIAEPDTGSTIRSVVCIVWHIGFTCGRVRAAPKATSSCDDLGNMLIGRFAQKTTCPLDVLI
jgi:hypothetical protein